MTHLYLQHNCLKSITDDFSFFYTIEFLALQHNQIEELPEHLKTLSHLAFLDLSHNKIENLTVQNLPTTLEYLNLEGNPCMTKQDSLIDDIIKHCPQLIQLDDMQITIAKRKDLGMDISESFIQKIKEFKDFQENYERPKTSDYRNKLKELVSHIPSDSHSNSITNMEDKEISNYMMKAKHNFSTFNGAQVDLQRDHTESMNANFNSSMKALKEMQEAFTSRMHQFKTTTIETLSTKSNKEKQIMEEKMKQQDKLVEKHEQRIQKILKRIHQDDF
eukprot:CAMPEP_0117422288 /NCGR_PEP_ID=MMETSP0758-20121206/3163_1 /TAXON_ID=63605 /ORGANISM="Percolomonas cosmopolitus, Strain AE-1 (ATCC 50343)" /LENGTH=274 /DNA_ID=CAMNT_0005204829 /DNA_START=318 /DNA_END=1142 /DNA_ORIENTATION=+